MVVKLTIGLGGNNTLRFDASGGGVVLRASHVESGDEANPGIYIPSDRLNEVGAIMRHLAALLEGE